MTQYDSQLRDLILAHVPADGERIGNIKLQKDLTNVADFDFDELDYKRVRDALVAEGLLGKGQGKGGAVYRTAIAVPHLSLATSGLAQQKAGSEPEQSTDEPEGDDTLDGSVGAEPYGTYQYDTKATSRPDVGVQEQFNGRKPPKQYRYDSSLAPELCWDENAERDFAEWLLNLVAEAATQGEAVVFAQEQVWKGNGERFTSLSQCVARLKSLTQPFLTWAGKAERQQISVPTVPLFVHERHSTQNILKTLESHRAVGTMLDLFGDSADKDIADQLDAYTHKEQWANRLILGDSLQVMNSLLEYEGMGGQVQMVYFDPPYGIKFGSNFQPFVKSNRVSHGKDDDMIREPEMVKAYRDTWELGIHSYLSYFRDRIFLARELLKDSGSIFVQISSQNVHRLRSILDEVFGENNFISEIIFRTTTGKGSSGLDSTYDIILWYAKNSQVMKFNRAYKARIASEDSNLRFVEVEGVRRKIKPEELEKIDNLPSGYRLYRPNPLTSQTPSESTTFEYEFEGRKFKPGKGGWKTNKAGMDSLKSASRLIAVGNTLSFVRYLDDFPYQSHSNIWDDTRRSGFGDPKIYAVQTATKVIERCIQMTTEPGDLVLDPTCGSGTSAFCSEKLGRRWITCDTSRVPLALARQRLLTATFPWYELKEPSRGPAGGLVYKRKQNRKGEEVGGLVPRITLKSIANNEEPETITLVDRPEENKDVTRVCGPFTVEATIQAAHSLEIQGETQQAEQEAGYNARSYLDRMIDILRRSRNLRLPGNRSLKLDQVRVLDNDYLHAEAVDEQEQRIAIVFGPEDGAISSDQVFEAASEAYFLKYSQLYLFGFAIQAKARELVDDRKRLRLPCTYISVTPDVAMDDLLKTSHTDQLFSITGLPDARILSAGLRDDGKLLYQVELLGLDTFRPDTLETESVEPENLPCWMLDTSYNGMAFCADQVFFPRTSAWDNLQKSLKGQFNKSVWEHLAGTTSEPFVAVAEGQVAIKVIDERGNELMRVFSVAEAEQ
ncbi:site-specific DNA-methyltransferase [Pseudomonas sp. BO3-4]|nr:MULTISPECIES: site-specific DNA-methyltransferase [Pseudomonas]MCO3891996.1 site-specific DNA-methyltransferase [Pseudomonas aeruginosa]WPO29428.1 site-specific DNA-methyltransferase [Pseudomonas sp. BO3-4]